MKYYKILDTRATRKFVSNLIGDIYPVLRFKDNYIILDTQSGAIIFKNLEVEEVQI